MAEQQLDRPVLQPGPNHPITIEPNPSRLVVTLGGEKIADTTAALTLREASYPPVQYVPLEDVERSRLTPTDHETYCPFKGECGYYTVEGAGETGVNSIWEYRDPYPAVAEIKGHVAFYADRFEIAEQPA
jgi:uncharacterized protein (DUF427 family)